MPVLHDVSLRLAAGRMTGLVGENGAGKSTLIKILTGLLRADAGRILVDGEAVSRWGDQAARDAGVAVIHQELLLVPELTVAENIVLGEPSLRGGLGGALGVRDDGAATRRARELLATIGITDLDVHARVRDISPSRAQTVLIARSLRHRSRMLILDEPTAALAPDERTELFALLRRLLARGTAVLFVSHHLHEVEDLCDDAVVLRNGRAVARLMGSELTVPAMVHAMLDRSLEEQFPPLAHEPAEDVALRVRGLDRRDVLHDVDLDVRRGEILGITGLLGAGKTELARALTGVDAAAGTVEIDGSPSTRRDPRESLRQGLQLVPEERKVQGVFPLLSVFENGVVSALAKGLRHLGATRWRTGSRPLRALHEETVRGLGVRHSGPSQLVSRLSGGNQQKLIIGRALACTPHVLILDEPTRGVDVGSKRDIYRIVIEQARRGVAVIVISSDTREVLGLAHRILVMRDGCITAEVRRGAVDNAGLARLLSVPAQPETGDARSGAKERS